MRNGNWPLHARSRKDLGGLKHNLQEKQETFKQALIKHKAHKELIIKTQFRSKPSGVGLGGIPLTRGQINLGTQSWPQLGLQNRRNQVIYCTEWTMRVPEAVTGASIGRPSGVGRTSPGDFDGFQINFIDFN